jgi:hypothetical protein
LGALGRRTARLLAVAVLVTMVVALLPPVSGTGGSATDGQPIGVIVQARPGGLGTAARQVQDLGGRVGRQLQVINGFSAVVPLGAVGRRAGVGGGPVGDRGHLGADAGGRLCPDH